ncbi:MAG: amidohydrolase family protein [Gammaproteobacteria bacterium]
MNRFRSRHLILMVLLLHGGSVSHAAQPVIDMHLHAWPYGADGPPDHPKNLEVMNETLAALERHNVVLATASGPQAFLERWGREAPGRLLLGPVLPCEGGLNPNWFRYRCYENGAEFPDPAWLRSQYESGAYQVMGEVFTQYAGMSYDDPRMRPYYELAQELGIPVAFHTHSAPPLTASRCCPNFRIRFGDPMLLEEVLIRYPKLKVQVMHANPLVYPMLLDLMAQYPKIYVELSPFQRILPRGKFHRLLKTFQEAGVLSRVMFGTDGDDHGAAIEAYSSADFLSERELEGILCRNAARFLRRRDACE